MSFTVYTPNSILSTLVVGTTDAVNPLLLLQVNGIVYSNGYRVENSGSVHNFFPAKDGANILLCCLSVAGSSDLAPATLYNVEVLVIGN